MWLLLAGESGRYATGDGGAGATEWRRPERGFVAEDELSRPKAAFEGESGAGGPGCTFDAQLLMAATDRLRAFSAMARGGMSAGTGAACCAERFLCSGG